MWTLLYQLYYLRKVFNQIRQKNWIRFDWRPRARFQRRKLTSKYFRNFFSLFKRRLKILNLAQWLWLSWQSGRFRHQRSAVQIPSLAKFLLNIVNCQLYWKDDNKEKEAGNGSFFWNKLNGFNVGKCYLNLTKKCNPNLTNIIL